MIKTISKASDIKDVLMQGDVAVAADFKSTKSNNKLIFDRGHMPGKDPGAVYYNPDGSMVKETDVIATTFFAIATEFIKDGLTFSFTGWSILKTIISIFNAVFGISKKHIIVSIHADSAPLVEKRPLTFGVYHGSEAGRLHAVALTDEFKRLAGEHDLSVSTWVRHHSKSPRKTLGLIKYTSHIALILECDFVGRVSEDRDLLDAIVARALANVYKSNK